MNDILIPHDVFVGDTAQFFFFLSEKEGAALQARYTGNNMTIPLTGLIQNEEMTLKEIRIIVREKTQYLLITFVPWETGSISFPSLSFLKLERALPAIKVLSVLDQKEAVTLQPPKPPLLIPGTDSLLYGAVISGVGCLTLLGLGGWFLFRKFIKKRPPNSARKRMSMLRKRLKQLHKEARKIQQKVSAPKPANTGMQKELDTAIRRWYGALDYALREYVYALYAENHPEPERISMQYFSSATYTELGDSLAALFAPNRNIPDLFSIFYAMLEKQRFAGSGSDLIRDYAAGARDIMQKISYITNKTEKEYAAISKSTKRP